MIKTRLMLGAAIAAFGIIPVAQADQVEVSQIASWDNSVDVSLSWDGRRHEVPEHRRLHLDLG